MSRMRQGMRAYVSRNIAGETITPVKPGKWKHPWQTTPSWKSEAAQWTATIEPGFVDTLNAVGFGTATAPVYRATISEQQQAGNPWEINPLTGKPFFSASVFQQPTPQQETTIEVDLPIDLQPSIPLNFYNVGWDGDPSVGVPQFFLDKGAAEAPPTPADADPLSGNPGTAATPPKGLRLLRACDVWMHLPRVALTSDVQVSDGTVTGQSTVNQTLSIASPGPNDAAQIFVGEYAPIPKPNIDPLSNDYTEIDFDQILISTVYLLSAPDVAPGSLPDGSWQPYVKHNLFWNLSWAQPQFRIQPQDQIAGMFPALADGVAQGVINFLASSLNDATQQVEDRIAANSLAGHFWTCTGGGHSSNDKRAATAGDTPPDSGPDKTQNAAAKAAAAAAARATAALDPAFPYNAQPFPLSLLSV